MKAAAAVAVAAAVLAAVTSLRMLSTRGDDPPDLLALRIAERSADFGFSSNDDQSGIRVTAGQAVLVDSAMRLAVERGTVLARRAGLLVLVAGNVDVDVTPQPAPAVARLAVSDGMIEVHGTRFLLSQDRGGQIRVLSGQVVFVANDGRRFRVAAGESLHWPVPITEAPAPSPDGETPSRPRPAPATSPVRLRSSPDTTDGRTDGRTDAKSSPDRSDAKPRPRSTPGEMQASFDADDLRAELERLRLQRRFEELAALLERSLPHVDDVSWQESLSYELGDLLTYRIRDRARACQHWREHRRAFASGAYDALAAEAELELQCQK